VYEVFLVQAIGFVALLVNLNRQKLRKVIALPHFVCMELQRGNMIRIDGLEKLLAAQITRTVPGARSGLTQVSAS
jgi:hypothetical protein